MKQIRTALFAPGSNTKVMMKALGSSADAVILDLEDSVSLASKVAAREQVVQAIRDVAQVPGEKKPIIMVRANAADTGLLEDDVVAVAVAGLEVLMLPKAETVEQVQALSALLDRLEAERQIRRIEIALQIETALGVYRCFELIKASPRVTITCIGSARDGDLQNDLGCGWSAEGTELLYARSKVLLDSRAAGGVQPLDGVFADLEDEAGLARESRLSASLGYAGRTVIHPKQFAAVLDAYAVSARDIAYYKRVVNGFEAVEKTGVAAITIDNKLVDYAMYKQAKRVLGLAVEQF
jgi:citrate lyase subunit beta/citryl-CoA lyase